MPEIQATLFVKNLDPSVTNQQLEGLFGDIGPTKLCFVATNKETGKSSGFGYVRYTLLGDAKNALEKLNGKKLNGKSILISYALPKPKDRKPSSEKSQSRPLSSSPTPASKKMKFEKQNSTDNSEIQVVSPKETTKTGDNQDAEDDTDEDISEDEPVEKKRKQLKPSLKVSLKTSLEPSSTKTQKMQEQDRPRFSTSDHTMRERTLIVANIPLDSLSDHGLEKLIRKHGTLEHLELGTPKEPLYLKDPVDLVRAKAVFTTPKDARKAQHAMHKAKFRGKRITAFILSESHVPTEGILAGCRVIARNLPFNVDEAQIHKLFKPYGYIHEVKLGYKPKTDKNGKIIDGKIFLGYAFVQYLTPANAKAAIDALNATLLHGRMVVVDLVVPKDDYEKALAKAVEETAVDASESESEVSGSEHDANASGSDDENGQSDEGNEDGVSQQSEGSDSEDEEKEKEDLNDKKTLFFRNLSFITTEEDMIAALQKFGRLQYCRIVVDRQTKKPKGTAFARFMDAESARNVYTRCKDRSMANIYDAEGSDGIQVHGRPLYADYAVSKDDIQKLAALKAADQQEHGSRRLDLLKEGYIPPRSKEFLELSEAEQKMRMDAFDSIKAKMKNINYAFNSTRLLVRNIPKDIESATLSKIFNEHALIVKQKDEKTGTVTETKITSGRKNRVTKVIIMRHGAKPDDPKDKSGKFSSDETAFHQSMIDKESRKAGRSMGFAFVEFHLHKYALNALRSLNGNPAYFSPEKRLVIEFAIENMLAKKAHEENKLKFQRLNASMDASSKHKKGFVHPYQREWMPHPSSNQENLVVEPQQTPSKEPPSTSKPANRKKGKFTLKERIQRQKAERKSKLAGPPATASAPTTSSPEVGVPKPSKPATKTGTTAQTNATAKPTASCLNKTAATPRGKKTPAKPSSDNLEINYLKKLAKAAPSSAWL